MSIFEKTLVIVVTVINITWCAVSLLVVSGMYTKIEKLEQRGFFAYGYFEKDNVWNRIRVDEQGNAICHKQE